ncbi:MAG: DUF4384 domain-containing protein [Syntrophales bacterium]|nr:DUF4384 domain-containing protein [Syntrophales bacterium]
MTNSIRIGGCFIIFLSLLFLTVPQNVCGQDIRAVKVVPDQEKRSSIHEVDGYAYLSENMTMSQIRAAAFATAKRQALEAAKTYIKAKTKVKDFQVDYDMIWSNAEGAVTVLEQKDHGVVGNNRYHVWIKAEVLYDIKPKKPEGHQTAIMDSDAPLTVKVWTEKKHYGTGENIRIFIQGNRDFYARIVDVTSSGQIIQLLPNDYRKINFFRGGEVYTIPDKGDQFDLQVVPPYGEDHIVVYASEVPLGEVAMNSVGQGLRQYRGLQKNLAAQTRGIKVTGGGIDPDSGAEFYEATWTLTTKK